MSTGRRNFNEISIETNKKRDTNKYTHVVHSRDRDLRAYPLPSSYEVDLGNTYKNIKSITLKGSLLPKRETNVNGMNKLIPFNVQDYLTSVTIVSPGRYYTDGTYTTPDVTVSAPSITGGTQAEVSVVVEGGCIQSVTVTNPGSGYLRGYYGNLEVPSEGFYKRSGADISINIPYTDVRNGEPACLEGNVGNELVAVLNEGQYDFAHPNDSEPGLCREVTRALQEATQDAIDQGLIVPLAGEPQTGAQYWPYAAADDATGSCWLFTPNANASENTNVAIQRGQPQGLDDGDLFFEILFGENEQKLSVADTLLGMGSSPTNSGLYNGILKPLDLTSGTDRTPVDNGTWTSAPVRGLNNYDLTDYPKYVVMVLGTDRTSSINRIYSSENTTINRAYTIIVFDANSPDTIYRAPSSTAPVDGTGNSNFNSLLIKPGTLKGIKGNDFDSKKYVFQPQMPRMNKLYLEFFKLNGDYYNFQGADHTIILELECDDNERKY